MIEIEYWEVLDSTLNSLLGDGLIFVGEKIKKTLQTYLQKNWYRRSKPMFYERTYDVLNSITVSNLKKTTNNENEVEIYFDKNKIISRESTFQLYGHMKRFHHHMSINHADTYNGESISILLPYWMEYGQSSKLHSFSGSNFLADTIAEINVKKIHITELEKALRKVGVQITNTW